MTQGSRVTLTYNLYYSPKVGDLADVSPAMDATMLPLYQKFQDALWEPLFMSDGVIHEFDDLLLSLIAKRAQAVI